MADMKARAIVEIVDRTGPGLRRVNSNLKRLSGNMRQAGRSGDALRRAGRNIDRLGGAAGRAGSRIRSALLRAFERVRASASRTFSMIRRGMSMIGRGLKIGLTAAAGGAAAGGWGLWKLGTAVLETGETFEMLKVRLEALEGSSDKAQKAMEWITTFAEKTPLELEQVMDAYANLKAMGIDPTNGSLRALVDTMAMQGLSAEGLNGIILSLGQAYAQGKLQGDTFREMATRGIPAAKLLAKALKKTEAQILELASKGKLGRKEIALLVALLGKRAKGASEKMSKTLRGIKSNISDLWTSFKRAIADAGFFDAIKAKFEDVRAAMERMKRSGEMDAWAQRLSRVMTTIADAVWNAGKAIMNADLDKVEAFLKNTIDQLSSITAADVRAAFDDVKTTIMGISEAVQSLANAIKTLQSAAQSAAGYFRPLTYLYEQTLGGPEAQFRGSLRRSKPSWMEKAAAKISGRQVSTVTLKGPLKPGFSLDDQIERGGQRASQVMEQRAPGIGQRISRAIQQQAATIGFMMGQTFAQQARAAVAGMRIKVDAPQGVYGPRRGGTVVRRAPASAAQPAPVGVDAPAPPALQ